jgi:acyl carrier protein
MIPSVFVMLEALPLTPNGKIDRRALPAPNGLRSELETTYVRPQTETERRLVQVWQEALHVEKIGIHDNFFDLGGHSLLAAKIHRKLQDESEQSLSIIDLFQYPTIHALARHIHQKQDETLSPEAGQTHAQRRRAYQDSIQQSSQRRRQHRTAKQKGGTSNE